MAITTPRSATPHPVVAALRQALGRSDTALVCGGAASRRRGDGSTDKALGRASEDLLYGRLGSPVAPVGTKPI
jgi:hypothetical protein